MHHTDSMLTDKNSRRAAGWNPLVVVLARFLISPMTLLIYRGRGRYASKKPDVITRYDLLNE